MRLKLVTLTWWFSSSARPARLIAPRTFHSIPSSSTIVPKVRWSTATAPAPAAPAVPTMTGAEHPPRSGPSARRIESVEVSLRMSGSGESGE